MAKKVIREVKKNVKGAVTQLAPKKQEKVARKQAKKSGQMTPTAIETKRSSKKNY